MESNTTQATREYLHSISYPGESWVQVKEFPNYWVSTRNRAASTNNAKKKPNIIRVKYDEKRNLHIITLAIGEHRVKRMFIEDILYNRLSRLEALEQAKQREEEKRKRRSLSLAEYWALELLGSADHPDYPDTVNRLAEIANWKG